MIKNAKSLEIKAARFSTVPKRLWLEVNRPNVSEETTVTQANFRIGHEVGEIARQLYDPDGSGTVVNAQLDDLGRTLARSIVLLDSSAPIFEAGFAAWRSALAFAAD